MKPRLLYSFPATTILVVFCMSGLALAQDRTKGAQPTHAQQVTQQRTQVPPAPAQMNMGILAVTSDQLGTLFVDGKEAATLQSDKVVTLSLVAGQHFVDLRDGTGQKQWEKVVSIPAGAQVVEKIVVNAAAPPDPPKSPAGSGRGQEAKRDAPIKASDAETNDGLSTCSELFILSRFQEAAVVCADASRTRMTDGHRTALLAFLTSSLMASRKSADAGYSACKNAKATKDCDFGPLALGGYQIGKHEPALAAADTAIAMSAQDVLRILPGGVAPTKPLAMYPSLELGNTYLSLGWNYCTRAKIQFAVSDHAASLRDFDSAFASLQNASIYGAVADAATAQIPGRGSGTKFGVTSAGFGAFCRLARAVVLFRLNRPGDAIGDFNAFASYMTSHGGGTMTGFTDEKVETGELRDAIRARIGDAGSGVSTATVTRDSDIRLEIDTIARGGRYAPMPEPQIKRANNSASATARGIFRNDTTYVLHVFMSGATERRIDLQPGGSSAVDLPPGSYRLAARVDSATVEPFYGVQALDAGTEYTSQFFVK